MNDRILFLRCRCIASLIVANSDLNCGWGQFTNRAKQTEQSLESSREVAQGKRVENPKALGRKYHELSFSELETLAEAKHRKPSYVGTKPK
jgi:hypothetical protein